MSEPLAEPLPASQVSPEEHISRYLLRPKWFDVSKSCVFAQAFVPTRITPENQTRQTSVYRIDGCQEEEIWRIGEDCVTKLHRQKLPVLARADFSASHALSRDLQIAPHPTLILGMLISKDGRMRMNKLR